jgi:enoyl-CoA hydratase/carnithine racemase
MPATDTADGSDETAVRVERPADGVAVVILDRHKQLNAISPSTMPKFTDALAALANDGQCRAVVLTGAGRAFCTGMDLSAIDEIAPLEVDAQIEWMRGMHAASLVLDRMSQPTIAAVNGPAIGGGWAYAMACDIRIAAPSAVFGATFVKMEIGPDGGISRTLPRVIGHARTLELLLTAEKLEAEAALRLGIVSRIAADAVGESVALAERIAAVPAHTSRTIKATLLRAAESDMNTTLFDIEPTAQAQLICHPDFSAHAAAWLSPHSR